MSTTVTRALVTSSRSRVSSTATLICRPYWFITLLVRANSMPPSPSGTLVTLDEAAQDTFINLKEGHSVRIVQDTLFRRHGLQPNILLETDSLEVARRVALGTGSCMLCSNIYVDDLVRRHGAFYPLKNYENHRHFYACYPKEVHLPRFTAGFIQIVTQVLSQKALSSEL